MDTPETRVCTKCLQEKPLDAKYFHIRKKNGRETFRRECIDCRNKYCREYSHAHRDELSAKRKVRYAANRETILADQKQKRKDHPEIFSQYEKTKRKRHRFKIAARNAIYYLTHRQALRKSGKVWYETNKVLISNEMRQWRKDNPALAKLISKVTQHRVKELMTALGLLLWIPTRVKKRKYEASYRDGHRPLLNERRRKRGLMFPQKERAYGASRRARMRGASRKGETIILELLAKRDGWKCHICKKKVTRKTWSRDHIIPVSLGGSHTWDNVILAHASCNSHRRLGNTVPAQLNMFPYPIDIID